MRVAIAFDSATGRTKTAAEKMAEMVRAAGHECTIHSIQEADPAVVSTADAVCIGSWCQGLFVLGQHATKASMEFIDSLEPLGGKPAAVFCTYKLAVGSMLTKMAARLEGRGARVIGQFKSRGAFAPRGFDSWVESL